MENFRFKIEDPSLPKNLPEKQQITIFGGVLFWAWRRPSGLALRAVKGRHVLLRRGREQRRKSN